MPQPAARLAQIPPYPFLALSQKIREMSVRGLDVIRLDIGSPDMPPPDDVIAALAESAAQPGHHGYTGYKGTAAFRAAVAAYYQRRFGITVDPETQVLPLLGSKEGIVNLSLGYLDRGDVALVPDIGYPSYAMGAHLAGAEVCWLPMTAANGYQPDLDAVPADVLARARLLWVNYPNNPTGATVELDFYQRAVDFCARHDILLVSDNAYVDVTFDGFTADSALSARGALDHAIEFVSFSKSHNMAGWRLGAAVGAVDAVRTLLQVKSNMDSGHFQPIYDAGVVAAGIDQEWIDARNRVYQLRRDRLLDTLPQIGLSAARPKGSLYVWARVEGADGLSAGDGAAYAAGALEGARVALAPGTIYGPGGTSFVRFSIGMDDARFDEALDRLQTWYAAQKVL